MQEIICYFVNSRGGVDGAQGQDTLVWLSSPPPLKITGWKQDFRSLNLLKKRKKVFQDILILTGCYFR